MRIARFFWRALQRFIGHNGVEIAGYIAYTALVALFPFLIFLLALAGLIGQTQLVQHSVDETFAMLPAQVTETIRPIVADILGKPHAGLLSIGVLGTLWAASSGVEALRLALNQAFAVKETRPLWKLRGQSAFFILFTAVSVLLASALIIAGPLILKAVMAYIPLPLDVVILWNILRYLLAAGILLTFLTALYHILPNRAIGWRNALPGALFTVGVWLTLGSLFSLYLLNAGDYSITYGSLGGVVITLLFLHVSAMIFILGADVNGLLLEKRKGKKA